MTKRIITYLRRGCNTLVIDFNNPHFGRVKFTQAGEMIHNIKKSNYLCSNVVFLMFQVLKKLTAY